MNKGDVRFMAQALRLAQKGFGRTKPNPLVGAVIVKNGRVVATGFHTEFGNPHAEAEALAVAGENAKGATMYVNLEPCNHHGKTPPCTEAIIRAGIKRVVIAVRDPNPQAGGGVERLREAGIEVEVGLLESAAKRLNEPFLIAMQNQRPYVHVKAAVSLDGYLATKTGDSGQAQGGMGSKEELAYVHRLRAALDAVAVGANTVLVDDPLLTARGCGEVKQPVKVVFDTNLRIPPQARLFKDAPSGVIVVCAQDAIETNPTVAKELERAGAKLIGVQRTSDTKVDLSQALAKLWQLGITSILVEGGGGLIGSFVQANLVDRFTAIYVPYLFGDGIPMANLPPAPFLTQAYRLINPEVRRLGTNVLISGQLLPPSKQ